MSDCDWSVADRLIAQLGDETISGDDLPEAIGLLVGADASDAALFAERMTIADVKTVKSRYARMAGECIIAMTESEGRSPENDAAFYWQFCLDCPSPYYRYQVWKNLLPHE